MGKQRTRIMAISDLHGDRGLAKKLAEKAEENEVDLIILAGDISFLGRDTRGIVKPFIDVGKKVLLIPGNHEDTSLVDFISSRYSGVKNIHGYGLIHKDIGIFGVGGADRGPNLVEEEEIGKLLNDSHNYIRNMKKKILVTHMHPSKSKSEFSGIRGSETIRKSIEKFSPDVAIFGHIHEAGGTEEKIGKTRVINVSRKEVIFDL